MSVVIETTIGDIIVDLYTKERPNTCLNFLKLCKIKFYNLCIFYKIEKNFIAQAGDPTATGRGGESVFCHLYGDQAKYFDAEFKPRLKHEKLGTLSMVNNGNNMNGSQFFLTLSENLTYLDEKHSVFGEVTEGFDVLLKLNDAICDNNNRSYQDIRITHTVILHDPFEDPKGLEIPDASPEPTKEMLESGYIAPDEEIDDNKGKTVEEVEEKIKESEAKARATILEMVGDIPDAEVKPPENVLFVCKLNPVTTSEDLEVIFSRFGKILSCEVIKDKKTGESLQYAFIEFEREEDCEAAYFKMDNVLIDDRRIHVDFSQSVSKLYFNRDKSPNMKKFRSNFSLKETNRNDGYDLIFDNDDDNIVRDKNHKSKSTNSTTKNEGKKNKHYPEDKGRRDRREEYGNSHRKDKDSKKYPVKESYNHREYDQSHSSDRRSEKDRSYRYKEDYSDKNRSLEQSKGHKYRNEDYYSGRKIDSDHHSKYRHSSANTPKTYRYSDDYHKSSSESYSRKQHTPTKRIRKDSTSPDQTRKSCEKSRNHSHDYSMAKKYSDRPQYDKRTTEKKTHDYKSKDVMKQRIESSSHKQKKDKLKKSSSKKLKTKKTRSSSVSSSTSSSSSSSSSTSASDSSSGSSQSNRKKRHHQKRKKETKSLKKRKYNS